MVERREKVLGVQILAAGVGQSPLGGGQSLTRLALLEKRDRQAARRQAELRGLAERSLEPALCCPWIASLQCNLAEQSQRSRPTGIELQCRIECPFGLVPLTGRNRRRAEE